MSRKNFGLIPLPVFLKRPLVPPIREVFCCPLTAFPFFLPSSEAILKLARHSAWRAQCSSNSEAYA